MGFFDPSQVLACRSPDCKFSNCQPLVSFLQSQSADVILSQYIGYAHTAWNGATDLFLTCLPATMLWKLQMNIRTKLGLAFLLGLSLLYVFLSSLPLPVNKGRSRKAIKSIQCIHRRHHENHKITSSVTKGRLHLQHRISLHLGYVNSVPCPILP